MIYDEEIGDSWPWHPWIAKCLRECRPAPMRFEREVVSLLESQGIAEALWAQARGLDDLPAGEQFHFTTINLARPLRADSISAMISSRIKRRPQK